jgi:ATP adenylyltransferase
MDTLWAPWRLGYLQGEAPGPTPQLGPSAWRPDADHDCFLCRAAAAVPEDHRVLGVVEKTARSLVIINRFPYGGGHLLIAPLDHRAGLERLADADLLDLQHLLVRWCRLLGPSLRPHGFNIGLNLGAVAGAGVPGHLHWHLLPRWPGDVNFMPAIAGVRVISQALDALWEQLAAAAAADPLP